MSEEKVEQEKLTPEQLEANRKKVIDYYKKQAEVLKFQAEYEKLLAEIEMHRAKRMEMIIRQAQMAAGPQDPDPNDQGEGTATDRPEPISQEVAPDGEKKLRTLKKVD